MRFLKPVYATLVCALLLSFVPPAWAQQPAVDGMTQRQFLPLINVPNWQPRFAFIDASENVIASSPDGLCVDPITGQVTTASPVGQCLLGQYITLPQGNGMFTFPGEKLHQGKVSNAQPFSNLVQLKDFMEGGHPTDDGRIVQAGDGVVYWVDMSSLRPDILADGSFDMSSSAAGPDWGQYLFALSSYLSKVRGTLPKFTIPTNLPVSNYDNNAMKTPASCGMNGLEVRVVPSIWGHTMNPPRLKIGAFLDVINADGTERPVTPAEYFCMIPDGGHLNIGNFQFLSLRRLRLNEPSFAPINLAVVEEAKSLQVVTPPVIIEGQSLPALNEDESWGMIAQRTGETALLIAIGIYARSTGLFSTMKIFLIGPGACIERDPKGFCRVSEIKSH